MAPRPESVRWGSDTKVMHIKLDARQQKRLISMVSIASHKGLHSVLALHLTACVKMHLVPHSHFYPNKNVLLLKLWKNSNGSLVLLVINCCYIHPIKQLEQNSGIASARVLHSPARLALLSSPCCCSSAEPEAGAVNFKIWLFSQKAFSCSTEIFSCISSEWEIVSPVISLSLNTIATKIRPYIILIVAFKEFFTESVQTIQSSKVLSPVTESSTIMDVSQDGRDLGSRKQNYKTTRRTWVGM